MGIQGGHTTREGTNIRRWMRYAIHTGVVWWLAFLLVRCVADAVSRPGQQGLALLPEFYLPSFLWAASGMVCFGLAFGRGAAIPCVLGYGLVFALPLVLVLGAIPYVFLASAFVLFLLIPCVIILLVGAAATLGRKHRWPSCAVVIAVSIAAIPLRTPAMRAALTYRAQHLIRHRVADVMRPVSEKLVSFPPIPASCWKLDDTVSCDGVHPVVYLLCAPEVSPARPCSKVAFNLATRQGWLCHFHLHRVVAEVECDTERLTRQQAQRAARAAGIRAPLLQSRWTNCSRQQASRGLETEVSVDGRAFRVEVERDRDEGYCRVGIYSTP